MKKPNLDTKVTDSIILVEGGFLEKLSLKGIK
jgi:hypothetical protein